jgi:ribosome biogenesis GTPase
VPKKSGKKVRIDFRKNRGRVARNNDLTRDVHKGDVADDKLASGERLSGKGKLSRRRTVVGVTVDGDQIIRDVDESECLEGRVLAAIGGLHCRVEGPDQVVYDCSVRKVVRTLTREARNAVVTGDRVLFRPLDKESGIIERVEPRSGILARGHQRQQHILVANISQVAIIGSLEEPHLKPALIDRFLVSAEKGGVKALICLNKSDLVDLADLQQIIGLYARLGYRVVPTSSRTGQNIDLLRHLLAGEQTVFSGQSGVGKSSLLNLLCPGLQLGIGEVSKDTGKGRHTTRHSQLLRLETGGWVVDTPGIRQMEIWDVAAGEVEGFFREFRPFVSHCRFNSCLHLEEDGCAIRQAVRHGLISQIRYESYVRMVVGDD